MNEFWIYKITNKITNKFYVGQTYDFYNRMKSHKGCYDKKSIIVRSINKYGWENHEVKVLFNSKNITKKEGDEIEIYYIRTENSYVKYNSMGMNMTIGGRGPAHEYKTYISLTNNCFKKWKNKLGKDNVDLIILNFNGEVIKRTSDNNIHEFLKEFGYNTASHLSNIKRRITAAKHKVILNKYIVGFEDDFPYIHYLQIGVKKGKGQGGKPIKQSTKKIFDSYRESKQIPVLDLNTGFYFETMSEFCVHENRCFATIRQRFEENKYDGKYIMCKN